MPCEAPPPVRQIGCPGPGATGALAMHMCRVCRGKANLRARRGSISTMAQDPGTSAPTLQAGWTDRATRFVNDLYDEFMGVAGPPCPYAFCITGSGARKEACPYSDLDCFVVLDAGASPGDKQAMVAFSRSVKERLDHLAYDPATYQPGMAMKGMIFCAGGLNPGGWNNIGIPVPALTGTALELSAILEQNITTVNAALDHVVSGMQECRFAFGTAQLHADLVREVDLIMGQTCWKFASRPALTYKKRGGMDAIREVINHPDYAIPDPTATRFNIKKGFYRMPQFVIKGLAWYYGIGEVVTMNQITALVQAGRMSMSKAQLFINALDAPLKIRVLSHLHAQDESDYVRTAADATPNPRNEYVMSGAEANQLVALIQTLTRIRDLARRFVAQKDKVIGKRKNPFAEN